MFYQIYRPKILSEIDNSNPRIALSKILETNTIAHAYLFVGKKGTGKTSSARIFAKSLNCLANKFAGVGTSFEPCNTCKNCIAITGGTSADVVELDAASNRGINEMKELIKDASFLPLSGRYRIFIIDEAHMITTEGFNSLLKTLEEPPRTVIFILATTNNEKIPKTIQSRCIQVSFGTAKEQEIIRMLKRIAEHEKLVMKDEVLNLIASRSDKSFRDAAKLLEELVLMNKLTFETASSYLGIRNQNSFIQHMQSNSFPKVLEWIEEFTKSGGNIKILIEESLHSLHAMLIDESKRKGNLLKSTHISYLMKLLIEAYELTDKSPIDSIPLEIAVAEFYNKLNQLP